MRIPNPGKTFGLVLAAGLIVGCTNMSQEEQGTLTGAAIGTNCVAHVDNVNLEGQGVVAHGRMSGGGTFVADKIMAKHDEEYMAPEVADSIAKHVQDQTASVRHLSTECDGNDS